ncbi:putative nuclease HARBI1 [Merluccius polli]|uniref:Nuclease HARBI1 n=1 Tax=Merluccius polli TaxID=89951 RepID=A0AA47MSM3_MERPO|nr:putative nuclease HARBI1 [Merluccius polli]
MEKLPEWTPSSNKAAQPALAGTAAAPRHVQWMGEEMKTARALAAHWENEGLRTPGGQLVFPGEKREPKAPPPPGTGLQGAAAQLDGRQSTKGRSLERQHSRPRILFLTDVPHLNTQAPLLSGMAGVVGAVDGTHIQIIAPSKDEDVFVNRKKVHSINTQIAFDATFNILDVAKWPGSTRDPRILMGSGLRREAPCTSWVSCWVTVAVPARRLDTSQSTTGSS